MGADSNSRLVVILHADVAGSTALVQQDDQLAHARIRETYERLGSIVEKYHGRVRELRGDALLAEFERASDAVTAALAFQQRQREFLSEIVDDIAPAVRIGIAIGEVVIADGTVTGSGVVLAQRIEQLVEPGGVGLQGAAYETIPGRFPFEYDDLGEHELKGFDNNTRVFSARLQSDTTIPRPRPQGRRRLTIISVTAVALALIGLGAWWFTANVERVKPTSSQARLPDKPSIAVLAFNNMSDDPKQDYFADGIAEDIITDLSKVSGLFVVARTSSFAFKGKGVALGTIARQLGVRYVVEGSVRRAGDTLRITAQLIDSSTDGHLWAERYDGSAKEVFTLQDKVTAQIVDALAAELTPEESLGIRREETRNTEAHDAYLRGLSLYHLRTADDNAAAELHFRRAIELDTSFVEAHTALAKVYLRADSRESGRVYRKALGLGGDLIRGEIPGRVRKLLERVASQPDANYHVARSSLFLRSRQHKRAYTEAMRALGLSPNDADALEAAARALIYAGRTAEGVRFAKQALKKNPMFPAESLYLMGLAEYVLGNSTGAVGLLERAIALSPRIPYRTMLAVAYADTARAPEAKELYRSARAESRSSSVFELVIHFPFSQRPVVERFAANLRASGALDFGYYPLYEENRLSGPEIRALMFGRTVEGSWRGRGRPFSQQRDLDGQVTHTGNATAVLVGSSFETPQGRGQIKDDALCEVWGNFSETIEFCVTVFRVRNASDRIKEEGDYVMVTDVGEYPFRVVEP